MSKSDGPTIVQIDMKDVEISKIDWADLDYVPGEPFGDLPSYKQNPEPIVLEGTWDYGNPFTAIYGEQSRQLTMVASRRFLWWEVSSQRIRQTVTVQPHTVTQAPDGAITYSVPMTCDGPYEAIRSPWWERTLYAIARIWSY